MRATADEVPGFTCVVGRSARELLSLSIILNVEYGEIPVVE